MNSKAVVAEEWTTLTRPLQRILGTRTANALKKLGLETVRDLLFHVPFRLARRGELMPIESVQEGDSVTVVARVLDTNLRSMRARRGYILTVRISDGHHDLTLTFFAKASNPLKFHQSKLERGAVATFSGTISSYRGELQLTHPEYELVETEADVDPNEIAKPIPIYHAAQKVPSWHIERAVGVALGTISEADIPDPLPVKYRQAHDLPSKFQAIHQLHEPQDEEQWKRALQRMKHEEAFVLQALLVQRARVAAERVAPACPPRVGGILTAFDAQLPYQLTAGQQAVGQEISAELAKTSPMRRLLQGDVGSGKTVVAVRAMLQAVDAGKQAVLLAPTEVLAAQHYATITDLLGPLGHAGQLGSPDQATRVQLLTGSMGAKEKRQALAHIASGAAGLVIGTHALLEETVQIPFLGLVVVDEQHRFGVDQRDRLADGAHMLVMTATPIPRTIAMTSFGDLEVSTLTELPAGRAAITTNLVPSYKTAWVERMWERAAEEVARGGRVYVVCPRISADSEEAKTVHQSDEQLALTDGDPLASVEKVSQELRDKSALAGITIGTLHGQLPAEEKAAVMAAFSAGQAPILVATTVIEVGVDVPEATMMIVMDADRFGLSQLHQLRGRIGRGNKPGLCLAVFNAAEGTLAAERLAAFADTTNGFRLAEKDLELRNEGDVLGAGQSGRASSLRFLKVTRDGAIIETSRTAARDLLAADPQLHDHRDLAQAIAQIDAEHTQYLERG